LLALPLEREALAYSGRRNSFALFDKRNAFSDGVTSAENDPAVWQAASRVLELIDVAWSKAAAGSSLEPFKRMSPLGERRSATLSSSKSR